MTAKIATGNAQHTNDNPVDADGYPHFSAHDALLKGVSQALADANPEQVGDLPDEGDFYEAKVGSIAAAYDNKNDEEN